MRALKFTPEEMRSIASAIKGRFPAAVCSFETGRVVVDFSTEDRVRTTFANIYKVRYAGTDENAFFWTLVDPMSSDDNLCGWSVDLELEASVDEMLSAATAPEG